MKTAELPAYLVTKRKKSLKGKKVREFEGFAVVLPAEINLVGFLLAVTTVGLMIGFILSTNY